MTRIPELESALWRAAQRQAMPPRESRLFHKSAIRLPAVITAVLVGAGGVATAAILRSDTAPPLELRRAVDPRPDSVRLSAPVADPQGGSPWRLRVWRTAAGKICAQPGRATDKGFGLIVGRRFEPLDYTQGQVCGRGAVRVLRFMDNPSDPDTRLVATVVFGILPDDARTGPVHVNSLDSTRRATTEGAAYMAVLNGNVGKRDVIVRAPANRVLADYRTADVEAPGILRVGRIGPNPLPWAMLIWTGQAEQRCHVTGRLVDGDVGEPVANVPGAFVDAPLNEGRCVATPTRRELLTLAVRTQAADPGYLTDAPTDGVVVLAGNTHEDVTSVRIRPRPPLPTGRVAFSPALRAYVGVYRLRLQRPFARRLADRFRGAFHVTAQLSGGRTRRITTP